MKIIFLFICTIFFVQLPLSAQKKHSEAYEKGIILLDLHSSIGLYKDRSFVTQRIPVFIGGDFGADKLFSIGVYGGWSQRTFKDAMFPAYDVNYYYFGGRISAHLTEFLGKKTILKFNSRTTDVYGTFWLGRQIARQLTFSGNPFIDNGGVTNFGAYAGVRMYTMYRVGILVEFGAGPFGIFNVGICAKI
ncbi:MAG: hypothetical protein WED33_12895 [Bacteroidia bacterium]